MVTSDSFAEFLREQLAPHGGLTMQRMYGVFCDRVMFGILADNTLHKDVLIAVNETAVVLL